MDCKNGQPPLPHPPITLPILQALYCTCARCGFDKQAVAGRSLLAVMSSASLFSHIPLSSLFCRFEDECHLHRYNFSFLSELFYHYSQTFQNIFSLMQIIKWKNYFYSLTRVSTDVHITRKIAILWTSVPHFPHSQTLQCGKVRVVVG